MEWNEMEWTYKVYTNISVIWKTSLFSIGSIDHVQRTTKLFLLLVLSFSRSVRSFSDFDKIESKLIEGHKWHSRQAAVAVALKH